MPSGESSKFDFSALAAAIRGHVVLPGSTDYDELCSEVWNLKMQAKPSAIVLVVTTKDVQTTVKFIAENGLDFTGEQALKSGGFENAVLTEATIPPQQINKSARLSPPFVWD